MSAFMFSDSAFQTMAQYMAHTPPTKDGAPLVLRIVPNLVDGGDTEKIEATALRVVRGWHQANRRAMIARYGDRVIEQDGIKARCPVKKLARGADGGIAPGKSTPHRFIKLVQCLSYQCEETVADADEEAHEAALEEMERAICYCALALAELHPEYESAAWGD
jgi:hypothetical protein